MSSIRDELLKILETAPDRAIEQTLQYLKSILPNLSYESEPEGSSVSRNQSRSQWVEQLRQRRARLSVRSGHQTVIEMRQEERF
ncbi:hypothetical protein H6F51_17045 [Cyanobacteria bacterium FACHB-DQ100]|nr:hypothetical protein [Cyanobacteria bacterium FACHB-DQ100]